MRAFSLVRGCRETPGVEPTPRDPGFRVGSQGKPCERKRHTRCIYPRAMSPRMHLCLRIAAVAMLASAALWPRGRGGVTADELSHVAHAARQTRTMAAHAETTAAKLVSAPGSAKLVVAEADDSD